MEALAAEMMTATTLAYVQGWHAALIWCRAFDTMMGGSR